MAQAKSYADGRRNVQPNSFVCGDTVLVRQQKRNKLTSYYDPVPYKIVAMNGTMITAERRGKQIVRNSSFFKKVPFLALSSSGNASAPASSAPIDNEAASTPSTRIFCPPSAGGGQRRAAHPAIPEPPIPVESDEEFVDAEADVEQPVADNVVIPAQIDPVPEAAGLPLADAPVAEANPVPVLPGFRPLANASMANVPFRLPPNIRSNPYNLRERP